MTLLPILVNGILEVFVYILLGCACSQRIERLLALGGSTLHLIMLLLFIFLSVSSRNKSF